MLVGDLQASVDQVCQLQYHCQCMAASKITDCCSLHQGDHWQQLCVVIQLCLLNSKKPSVHNCSSPAILLSLPSKLPRMSAVHTSNALGSFPMPGLQSAKPVHGVLALVTEALVSEASYRCRA